MTFNPDRLPLPCEENDPEWWFSFDADEQAMAVRLCGGCPAAVPCLEDELAVEGLVSVKLRYGIRGGVGPAGRWEIAMERKRAAERKAAEEAALGVSS